MHRTAIRLIKRGVKLLEEGQDAFAQRNDNNHSIKHDFEPEIDRYGPEPIMRML